MATSCSLQATATPSAAPAAPPPVCLSVQTDPLLSHCSFSSGDRVVVVVARLLCALIPKVDMAECINCFMATFAGRALWPLLKCSRRWPYTCTRPATSHPIAPPTPPSLAQVYDPHNASAINADVAPHSMLP